MATTAANQPMRILHLSDLHFSKGRKWEADRVLTGLISVVQGLQGQGLTPDVVAITGDIAETGKQQDYQEAEKWLDGRLLPALGESFPRDHLLLVPGNHDVDREAVKYVAQAVQLKLLTRSDQVAVAELMADPDKRRPLLRRHDTYLEFAAKYRPAKTEPALPWWSEVFPIRGLNVHVAGLCSSWMSWSNQERGRLLVSRWQAEQVLKDADAADWKIALVHHPWSFLAEFDAKDMETRIHNDCHLVLRGHLHLQQIRVIVYPDDACLELAAGRCYDGSEYPNTFQLVELHRQGRTARVHFWLWNGVEWVEDRNAYSEAADGMACFPLGVHRPQIGVRRARRISGEGRQGATAMWRCTKCHKSVDEDFEVCWNCSSPRHSLQQPSDLAVEQDIRPETHEQDATSAPRRFPFGLRDMLIALLLLSLALGLYAWVNYGFVVPRERDREITRMIDSLGVRRPKEVLRGQWGRAVFWTHNLACNALLWCEKDQSQVIHFRTELADRLKGHVDIETIHWIWGQYKQLSSTGKKYSDMFKQQMLDEIAQVGPNYFFTFQEYGVEHSGYDHCCQGFWYECEGKYDMAIEEFNEALRLDPDDAEAHYDRGWAWLEESEYDKAVTDFNQAVRINPQFTDAYDGRGNSWRAKGEYDKAIADFDNALRINPRFADAYCSRGTARWAKGDYDRTIKDYDQALRLNSDDAVTYVHRDIAQAWRGSDKGFATTVDALDSYPTNVKAYLALAWLRTTCPDAKYRDGKKAVENAKRACLLTNERAWGCIATLAAAYAEDGQFDKAVEFQMKALAMAPAKNNDELRSLLELYKQKKPYHEEAKKK